MRDLQSATATAVLALRELLVAVCESRTDGAELLALLAEGGTRIMLDEPTGTLTIALPSDGAAGIVEVIRCDPNDDETFGRLGSGKCMVLTPQPARYH